MPKMTWLGLTKETLMRALVADKITVYYHKVTDDDYEICPNQEFEHHEVMALTRKEFLTWRFRGVKFSRCVALEETDGVVYDPNHVTKEEIKEIIVPHLMQFKDIGNENFARSTRGFFQRAGKNDPDLAEYLAAVEKELFG